jgi:hypothetical protein
MPKPMEGSIHDLILDTILAFAQRVCRKLRDLSQDICTQPEFESVSSRIDGILIECEKFV